MSYAGSEWGSRKELNSQIMGVLEDKPRFVSTQQIVNEINNIIDKDKPKVSWNTIQGRLEVLPDIQKQEINLNGKTINLWKLKEKETI